MISRLFLFRLRTVCAIALVSALTITWATRSRLAQAASSSQAAVEPSFDQLVKPFLKQNCLQCHNENVAMSGVRLDQLDAALEERHLPLWEHVRTKLSDGSMPPKGLPQPTSADRQRLVEWISRSLDFARQRSAPKNGLVRRLTVSQYRNTIRQLLLLEDDLTESLPPDAVSSDGFINNKETLQLSPLQLEGYLEIAEQALSRSIVDPYSKTSIQNFKVSLGESVNPNPFPETLVLGAGSTLLENKDVEVTQPIPVKSFAFNPLAMRTKYRYIEGYKGNDTVRGWREYDSIYHAVFADMRGSGGYPKGMAYSTIPEGLLLRPAIPNDEIFGTDGTYGPKANFKISLRELPDNGRFRVSVMAAKFNDGLLLDPGVAAQPENADAIIAREPAMQQTVTIRKAGIYQVDVYNAERTALPAAADASLLSQDLAGSWAMDGEVTGGRLEGEAKFVDSPFGKAISLNVEKDSVADPVSATLCATPVGTVTTADMSPSPKFCDAGADPATSWPEPVMLKLNRPASVLGTRSFTTLIEPVLRAFVIVHTTDLRAATVTEPVSVAPSNVEATGVSSPVPPVPFVSTHEALLSYCAAAPALKASPKLTDVPPATG